MKEIRIHGRGGQGSLVLAQFMAIAALDDGKYSQAFPFLGGGGERKGKAIQAFCRLSAAPVRLRCKVNEPDYVIVQDPTIIGEDDVAAGLKPGGLLLINTDQPADEIAKSLAGKFRISTFPANALAREILGRPIMNTALLGAFAASTGELSLAAVLAGRPGQVPRRAGREERPGGRSQLCPAQGGGLMKATVGAVVRGRTSLKLQDRQLAGPCARSSTRITASAAASAPRSAPTRPVHAVAEAGQKKPRYVIDYDYCKGCGLCVFECPADCLGLVPEVK